MSIYERAMIILSGSELKGNKFKSKYQAYKKRSELNVYGNLYCCVRANGYWYVIDCDDATTVLKAID